eukprot:jgi/Ulvmu1/12493/UM009_0146.1
MHLVQDGYQQAAWEEEAENAYNHDLQKAAKLDFSDLHGSVRCCCDDRAGHPVVLVQAERLLAPNANCEKIFKFVIVKLDEVVDLPYSVICVHGHEANAKGARVDTMLALRWYYERLPVKYKLRLKTLFIANPTNALRSIMAVMCPFFTHGLWSKVRYARRSEALLEHIEPGKLQHLLHHFSLPQDEPTLPAHQPLGPSDM